MDPGDALGVLGREGGDDGHAVTADGGDGFEIGLDTGPATAVGAGDGQDLVIGVRLVRLDLFGHFSYSWDFLFFVRFFVHGNPSEAVP